MEYVFNIPPLNIDVRDDVRTLSTLTLLKAKADQMKYKAELAWRIGFPCMVLVLALLAVPLGKVNPRSGKFAKLIPAILIYVVYANFMFIGRDWLIQGKIPMWMGFWWLHGIFIVLAILLMSVDKVRRA